MTQFPKFILIVAATITLALVPALPTSVGLGTDPAFAKKRYKKTKRPRSRKSDGPLMIVVSLGSQRIAVYDRNGRIAQSRISSGARGHRTPTGVFSVLQKRRRHYSNLYAGAAMPNMQRITWSGVAMHAGHLPGYPASHGCIRLYYSFSKWLFGITEMGTRVIVSYSSPAPKKIRHPILLKPLPPERTLKLQSSSSAVDDQANATTGTTNAIFVSQANAAEPPTTDAKKIRTRESVAAERQRELVKLANILKEAKADRDLAAADLKEAQQILKAALDELNTAQSEAKKLDKTIAAASKAQEKLNKQLRSLFRNGERFNDAEKIETAHASEDRLEAELLTHEAEREMAQKESEDLANVVSKLKANAGAATNRRNQRKRRFVQTTKQLSSAQRALSQAQAAAARRNKPITVLISRKKRMLYVRQGYDDVLRVAVDVKNPEIPIGTHVYNALAYANDETELEWHVITAKRSDVTRRRKSKRRRSRRRRRHQEFTLETNNRGRFAQTPQNALDRIEIPQEVAYRLAELVKPGSALIISDEGLSNETGEYTDIIVSTR